MDRCCSAVTKLADDALLALNEAIGAACARIPGAESLSALAKRYGVRKEGLLRHRDGCLGLTMVERQKRRPRSLVYFVQSGPDGPIKIGFTSQKMYRRLHALQIGNPVELRVLVAVPGRLADEQKLHSDFSHIRMERGEWFKPDPSLLCYIEAEADILRRYYEMFGENPDLSIEFPPEFEPWVE